MNGYQIIELGMIPIQVMAGDPFNREQSLELDKALYTDKLPLIRFSIDISEAEVSGRMDITAYVSKLQISSGITVLVVNGAPAPKYFIAFQKFNDAWTVQTYSPEG